MPCLLFCVSLFLPFQHWPNLEQQISNLRSETFNSLFMRQHITKEKRCKINTHFHTYMYRPLCCCFIIWKLLLEFYPLFFVQISSTREHSTGLNLWSLKSYLWRSEKSYEIAVVGSNDNNGVKPPARNHDTCRMWIWYVHHPYKEDSFWHQGPFAKVILPKYHPRGWKPWSHLLDSHFQLHAFNILFLRSLSSEIFGDGRTLLHQGAEALPEINLQVIDSNLLFGNIVSGIMIETFAELRAKR